MWLVSIFTCKRTMILTQLVWLALLKMFEIKKRMQLRQNHHKSINLAGNHVEYLIFWNIFYVSHLLTFVKEVV